MYMYDMCHLQVHIDYSCTHTIIKVHLKSYTYTHAHTYTQTDIHRHRQRHTHKQYTQRYMHIVYLPFVVVLKTD